MLELFSLVKYCNITLFRYTLQISFKDGVITQTLFSLVCLYIVFFVQFSRYEFRLLKSEINTQLLEYLFQTLAAVVCKAFKS